jgi:hypothetical protein
MNCSKCHVDKDKIREKNWVEGDGGGWQSVYGATVGQDFDVEMEDKGIITEVVEADWTNGKEKLTPIYKHLYQCPVCKNIEIQ